MQSVVFDDDDDKIEPLFVKYGHSFADIILSPENIIRKSIKNISYKGYHELFYLHPKYFTPDPSILKEIGINQFESFFVLRFVALKGHHDAGHSGIVYGQKKRLIELLKPYGRIFITSEEEIEPEFEEYRLPIAPEKIHTLMYYATMFLGDSQTMTSEAAVLGTPAIKCNSFAGRLSVPNEIEHKYKLCYSFPPEDFDKMVEKIKALLRFPHLKQEWQHRRKKMLSEKIDVTAFLVWFVENYPVSAKIMKENPDYQWNFK